MALSQEERISISEKLLDIPKENANTDLVKAEIEKSKQKSEIKDSANKSLMDAKTALVNVYQSELSKYDGITRSEVVEQDIIDAATRKFDAAFFPTDPQTPTPTLNDGVWKNFVPFAFSKAVGKTYMEVYPATGGVIESQKIAAVSAAISAVEANTASRRSTGKICLQDVSGTCSIPMHTTQQDCTDNAGIWTPNNGPDYYETHAPTNTALSDLIAALNDWKAFVLTIKSNNQTEVTIDTVTSRVMDATNSINDIDNMIAAIDAWMLYPNFDTTTSLPFGSGGTAVAAFNAMDANDFIPSKLRANELIIIKNEVIARTAFSSLRSSQVSGYLGTVVQNASNGNISTFAGLYGERFRTIDLRINLMGGSKNAVEGAKKGSTAQDEAKTANDNALAVYSDVLKVTAFKAPAAGTNIIHVKDNTGFSVGNNVYIIATSQEEIAATITAISGTMITLSVVIPKKYLESMKGRMYRIL